MTDDAQPPIRTVAFGDNGDRHRFDERGPILESALAGREGITVDRTTDKTLFTPGVATDDKPFDDLPAYDALVLYHPSPRTQWTWNVRQLDYLEQYVREGGGLVALHSTLAILADDPHHRRLRELVGGGIVTHGPETDVRVEVDRPDHPIVDGVSSFEVHDEPYDLDHDPGVDVLARVVHDSIGESASLWTTIRGEGRICYCSNGHGVAAFEDPNFGRLVANAVEWVAGT